MNRPILIITIGYIIGIIWGLYFDISIVFLYALMIVIYYYIYMKKRKKTKFKMFAIKRYVRYIKVIINGKIIFIIIISSFISSYLVKFLNNKYESLYFNVKDIKVEGIIISNKKEEKYNNIYKIKVINEEYKGSNLYIKTNKKIELKYGDKIVISGTFEKPQSQRNYMGFDYKEYLKTLKIYGTIETKEIKVIENNYGNKIMIISNKIFLKIKENIELTYNDKISHIIQGIMLGYTDKIDENIKEEFSKSNISHVLAVSGMHISYIIIISKIITKKIFGKRYSYIISSLILTLYMFVTGLSASVVRAGIMGIINCMAFVFYRKSNIINNIAISMLIILIDNPFSLISTSFLLSFGGTIGIVMYNNSIEKILKSIKLRNRKFKYTFIKIFKKSESIIKIISVTISAQIVILPIMIYKFNTIGIAFLITNLLLSLIIGFIVMASFVQILLSFISIKIGTIIASIISIPTYGLIFISKLGDKIPFGNVNIITIDIYQIIIYYIIIYLLIYLFNIFNSVKLTNSQKRIKNIIYVIKYKTKSYKNKMNIIIIILISIIYVLYKIPKEFTIHFVDVGQGDCTLIITPLKQNILIDGGGSQTYEVGKNILIPYLLDRKISKIDYVMISHFDQDHVGGILEIIDKIKIKNLIISEQKEETEQYKYLIKKVKENNIKLLYVKQGDRLKIEKNVIIDILFPLVNKINENPINNNSIVAKITYNNFKALFTGDIEQIAEEELVKKYNKEELDVDILKIPHHGSKTSSAQKLLELTTPKISLIGVGENNKFGHPNKQIIQRLKNIGSKIYRTDECGEITIIIKKECIKLTTMVNNKIKEK